MNRMEPREIETLLDGFRGRRIVVVGDLMLDQFTWGRVRRISPEAPVPVVEVLEETYRPGGCGNVAANIRALGADPVTIAVVGRDEAARQIATLFERMSIDAGSLVEESRRTTVKTRIIAHNQQVVRTDREDRTPLAAETVQALAARFAGALDGADAVVVSDYDKGVVGSELAGMILPQAERARVPVFLDPKVPHADHYRPATVITPNLGEAELLAGIPIRDRAGLEAAGRRLLERFGCPYILITRGSEGMSLFGEGRVRHMDAVAREVFDHTGAGDTVISALALARAAGADMEEAARIANHAAGIVVGKIGTATVSRDELLEALVER